MNAARYDVFLSHTSSDKPVVEELARTLRKRGVEPWLDIWNLIPGEPWQEALEKALDSCATVAVCIGPSGTGPWQNEEMRAAINRRVTDKAGAFRVIPVLLPGGERGERSRLPLFLSATTWVEFRDTLDDRRALRRLVSGIRGVEPGPDSGEFVAQGICPYRGLQAFDVKDAHLFFGREALTEWLLDKLRPARLENRFLAVVGPSGSGKSSLARAGLLAALKEGEIPGSEDWPVAIFKPGAQPLESLGVALTGAARIGDPSSLLGLLRDLAADPRTLHLTTRLALRDAPAERRLVVLVDQFEEVFTLCSDEAQRRALIDNLLRAATAADGRTIVLLTLRADFYGHCAAHPTLAAALSDRQVLVGAMTPEELRRAIERPAVLTGCELEGGLADLLLEEVESQPGSLPLLQHALLEIWKRRTGRRLTVAAYRELGGVRGALERHAEEVYAGFGEAEREMCRRIFLGLVQLGEGEVFTRRRLPVADLLPAAGGETFGREIQSALQRLADARLLTTGGEKNPEVELAHEALITGWSRFHDWIDRDRESLRVRRRLDEAAGEWAASDRDPSYLYRGSLLAQAEEWVEANPQELNRSEREFLDASLALRDEERRREIAQVQALEEEQRRRAEAEHHRAEEQSRSAARFQRLSVVLGAVLVVAVGLAVYSSLQRRESDRYRRLGLAESLAGRANRANPPRSLLLALASLDLFARAGRPGNSQAENALRKALVSSRGLYLGEDRIRMVALDAQGRWLAANAVEGGRTTLWALETDPPRKAVTLDAESPLEALAVSADGRWLLTGLAGGSSRLFEIGDGSARPVLDLDEDWIVGSDPFSPDSRWLATRSFDELRLRRLDARAVPEPLFSLESSPTATAFSPDGRRLAIASNQGVVVWDLESDGATPSSVSGSRDIETLVFHPTAPWLLAAGGEDVLALSLIPGGTPVSFTGCPRPSRLSLSPEGRWLAAWGGERPCLWRWTPTGGADPLPLRGLTGPPPSLLGFVGGGRQLLVQAGTEAPRLLPLNPGGTLGSLEPSLLPLPGSILAVSPDGRWLLADLGSSGAPALRLRDLHFSGSSARTVPAPEGTGTAWAIAPGGAWLASGSRDGRILLQRLPGGNAFPEPVPLSGHIKPVTVLAFSPDGRWLASGDQDGTCRLWSLRLRPPQAQSLTNHPGGVTALAFSPDGKWIVTGGEKGTVFLRGLGERGALDRDAFTDQSRGPRVLSLAFDDRNRLAVGFEDSSVDIRIPGKWKRIAPLNGLGASVGHLLFSPVSPKGVFLAAGDRPGDARFWRFDPKTPSKVVTLGLHGAGAPLAFTPDGHGLLTASGSGDILRWELRLDALIETACRAAGRNLTPEEWETYLAGEPYSRGRPCPEAPRP